jgi:hypothetical protein
VQACLITSLAFTALLRARPNGIHGNLLLSRIDLRRPCRPRVPEVSNMTQYHFNQLSLPPTCCSTRNMRPVFVSTTSMLEARYHRWTLRSSLVERYCFVVARISGPFARYHNYRNLTHLDGSPQCPSALRENLALGPLRLRLPSNWFKARYYISVCSYFVFHSYC